MSRAAVNYMNYCISNHYRGNEAKAENDKMAVKNRMASDWEGACFGYTYSIFLNKLGKIDFDKNFANTTSGMNTIGTPILNKDNVQSAIHYYHILQYIEDISDTKIYSASPYLLYNYYKSYGAMPISYYYNGILCAKGHCIYMTEMRKNSDTNYTLFVIDPNDTDLENSNYQPTQRTLKIENNRLYLDDTLLTWLGYYPKSTYNIYDDFDLDGDYNNKNYTSTDVGTTSTSLTPVEKQNETVVDTPHTATSDTTTLIITSSAFELSSGNGENLYFDGQNFSGTMEVLDMRIMANGPDAPATFKLRVKNSDIFEYHNLAETDVNFCVISGGSFGSISGSGVRQAAIDFSECILAVDGTDMDYSTWLSIGISGFEHFYLSGENQGTFLIRKTTQGVATEGITGFTECGFSDKHSLSVNTAELTFSGADILDFADISAGNINFYQQSNGNNDAISIPLNSFN